MHHTAAYFGNIGPTVNVQLNALADGILTIQNNNFLPPADMMLLAAYAGSATLLRARLSSPTLRQITQPQIRPINVALLPANDPNVMSLVKNPLRVRGLEELSMQVTSGVAMTENCYGGLWLQERFQPAVSGDPIILRGTSTTAAVASTWTQIAYTLDDQLPNGLYALMGSEHISTTGVLHRYIVDNQFSRPGGLSTAALGNRVFPDQYNYSWGEWGRFRNTSLPRMEVLCNAADATHTIYLTVIKVG